MGATDEGLTVGIGPLADGTVSTRHTGGSVPAGSSATGPSQLGTASASVELPGHAMRSDELGRVSLFARLTFGLCFLGAALVPLLRGDPLARVLFAGGLASAAVSSATLEWLTRRPERYTDNRAAVIVQVQELAAIGAGYYFGVFSPFAALVSLGIYVYSLGASFRNAFACYLNLALGQGVLTVLILGGVIEDRGLIHADYLPLREQVLTMCNVQIVFALALVLGRLSRRKTIAAVTELDRVARAAAQREALLAEAKQELERAAWVGGPGRFSEQVLGDFELGAVIGRGAMGEIYEARNVHSNEPAAIKLMNRAALGDPGSVARFTREARIVASLSSPHVVRVIEVGPATAPLPFLAMELLRGRDLSDLLRERPRLPVAELITMLTQVAEGLAAAHAAGVIHRDLKPQNLFLHAHDDDARIWKILDFGVSKLASDSGTLTADRLVGTPSYMAPEQTRGGAVDHRADIYSLAVVAFRALTGQPAFSGGDLAAIIHDAATRMPPRPGALVHVPEAVDAVLAIALAKDPNDRFDDPRDFARSLRLAFADKAPRELRDRANAVLQAHPWRDD